MGIARRTELVGETKNGASTGCWTADSGNTRGVEEPRFAQRHEEGRSWTSVAWHGAAGCVGREMRRRSIWTSAWDDSCPTRRDAEAGHGGPRRSGAVENEPGRKDVAVGSSHGLASGGRPQTRSVLIISSVVTPDTPPSVPQKQSGKHEQRRRRSGVGSWMGCAGLQQTV